MDVLVTSVICDVCNAQEVERVITADVDVIFPLAAVMSSHADNLSAAGQTQPGSVGVYVVEFSRAFVGAGRGMSRRSRFRGVLPEPAALHDHAGLDVDEWPNE